MRYRISLLCLFMCSFVLYGWTQDSTVTRKKQNTRKITSSARKLSRNLESNEPDTVLAANYMELAAEFSLQGAHEQAEEYLERALNIYKRYKYSSRLSTAYRELARTQEARKKIKEAIENYSHAARTAANETLRKLNENDASRLQLADQPESQSVFIQSNMAILNKKEEKLITNEVEIANVYRQMAQNLRALNDPEGEIGILGEGVNAVKENPALSRQLKQELAEAYIADEQFDKAVEVSKEVLEESKKEENPREEIQQLKKLSGIYFETEQPEQGLFTLREAYETALRNGQTFEAINSLRLLAEEYKKAKQNNKILEEYENFTAQLEELIRQDSSLMDEKVFHLLEEKIRRLENERNLKDELITRQHRFNGVLLGSIALILLFLLLIIRAFMAIRKKNKRIALQSLRREMNPHFIFNSLNSVNQFIAQHNELEANKYLTSYSRLMRNMMENSGKDFIPLSKEIEQLQEYLELEQLRFGDKFTYSIEVDPSIDTETVMAPNMLLQPQLENAIWHGLRYKDKDGVLRLSFSLYGHFIRATIEDNGIGLKKSAALKTSHQKAHRSRGLNNSRERIALLNDLYHSDISMTVTEKTPPESGVTVILRFPLSYKKNSHE